MTSYPPPFDPSSQPQQSSQPSQPSQSPQPPQPPPVFPPGVYPPPLNPQPTRPAWATAIGVISIVWSSFALICTPISMAINAANQRSQEMLREMYPDGYASLATVHSLLAIVVGALLLTAGILLLKKRSIARTLHLVYAIANIGLVILNFIIMIQVQSSMAQYGSPAMQAGWKVGFVIGLLIGLSYPIFLLAWFLRPKIATTMREWQQKQ